MAFQVGTKVDPRLNQLDFSGFAKAGEIQGQMFADIGAQVGGAITEYVKKKKDKVELGQAAELIAGLPGAEGIGITDVETAKVAIKSLGGPANALSALNLFRSGQANTNQTLQSTDFNAQLQPGRLEAQEASITGQTLSNVATAQSTDFSAQLQPGRLEQQDLSNAATAQATGFAAELQPGQMAAQEQALAASIANVNAQDTKLQIEQEKLDSIVNQQSIDQANAANQQRMLNAVTGGNMSNLEYINAGGDMTALKNAQSLTQGQSFSNNEKMITGIEQKFSYLEYDYETNTWTDTRGKNRSGLPWQEFPELMNFLGTQESQVLSNQGFTIGNTIN